MTDKDKIDDIYRNKLDNYKMPVSDELLANIKNELSISSGVSKKFMHWKWIYGTITLLVVTGVAAYFYFSTSNTNNQITNKSSNQTEITSTENTIDKSNFSKNEKTTNESINKNLNNNISEEILTTTSVKQTDENTNSSSATISQNETKVANRTMPGTKSSNQIAESKAAAPPKSTTQLASNRKSTEKNKQNNSVDTNNYPNNKNKNSTDNNIDKKEKDIQASNNVAIASSPKIEQANQNSSGKKDESAKENNSSINTSDNKEVATNIEEPKQSETQSITSNTNNNSIDSTNNNNQNTGKSTNEPVAATATTTPASSQENKADSIKKQIAIKDSTAQAAAAAAANTSSNQDKTSDKNSKLHFYIGMYGGPSYANADLSGGNPAFHLLKKDDKKTFNYNAGIDAGALYKNISIELGIGVDNKGEKYSFSGIPQFDTTTYNTYYDSTLLTWVTDTNTIIFQKGISAFDSKNSYQFFRTQLLVGYQFIIKEKFYIHPSAGISYNFLIHAKSTGIDFESGNQIQYTKANGIFNASSLAMRAKLDCGIIIKEKWQLGIQPAYTRFVQSVYKKEEDIHLKPYSFDINISVRYKF